METVTDFILGGSKITADGDCSHEIKRCFFLGRKAMTNLSSIFKKQRHYLANKCLSSQSYGCSSGHKWMWEVDYKESWALKNWCFWTVIWRGLLRVLWTARRSNWSILKDIRSEYSLGRTEAEAPILWPSDGKNWLIWKDPDAGKDWRQEKGTTEDEVVGWHHRLNGREFK